MNVFVLCTGRSGSMTFHRACQHITNYTCSHELNTSEVGGARFAYPEDHIEIDNRLSWLLGPLDEAFGDRAFYVHLMRDEEMTAKSFDKRWAGRYSIIRAYSEGVLGRADQTEALCLDYCRTVNANISHFLRDKTRSMAFHLEKAPESFPTFWKEIGAGGDLGKALKEFEVRHNPSSGRAARAYSRFLRRMQRGFRGANGPAD